MLERGNCQGLTTKGTKDTKKYYPCPLRTSSSQLAANLIHGKAVSKASFEPVQQVTAMITLNPLKIKSLLIVYMLIYKRRGYAAGLPPKTSKLGASSMNR